MASLLPDSWCAAAEAADHLGACVTHSAALLPPAAAAEAGAGDTAGEASQVTVSW